MAARGIQTSLEYLRWSEIYEAEKPYEILVHLTNLSDKQKSIPRSNLGFEPRTVSVEDVRGYEQSFSLDTHGFAFIRHSTVIDNLKDPTSVNQLYIGEMAEVLKQTLGYDAHDITVLCFDIRVCSADQKSQYWNVSINIIHFFT